MSKTDETIKKYLCKMYLGVVPYKITGMWGIYKDVFKGINAIMKNFNGLNNRLVIRSKYRNPAKIRTNIYTYTDKIKMIHLSCSFQR